MKLSILIPVFNEEKTLENIVNEVQNVQISGIRKEIIIIDDASTDKTKHVINRLKGKYKNIKSFRHSTNTGKGGALKTAIKYISGDIIVIQDGDLEYDPRDFIKLIKPIMHDGAAVVYGSRMLGKRTGFLILSHYYGNKFLTLLTQIVYGQRITDMETCYKMMKKEVLEGINLESNRFDFEPEITAKIIRKGYK